VKHSADLRQWKVVAEVAGNNTVEIIFKAIDAGATATTRQVGDAFSKEIAKIGTGTAQLGQSAVLLDQYGNQLKVVEDQVGKTAGSHTELGKSADQASTSVSGAGNSAKKTSDQTKDLEKANHKALESYTVLGAAAGVAFYGITRAIGTSVQASNTSKAAMMGLQSVAEGMGHSFSKVQAAAESLASDGLLTISEAAAGLKNLLSRGFSLDEATVLMNRFKDSAAFGKQAALGFGEAVVGATEGLRQENSVLVNSKEFCPLAA
jgi:archaeosine-15-forming tRNA-guanine transglycosylase